MISIIIPFYNRYDLIMKRMAEIYTHIQRSHNEIEIIMVNNGSIPKQDSEMAIAFWQKKIDWFSVRYLKWEENVGFCGAMNRGAAKSNGDHLCFLSDDVMIKGDFVTPILDILQDDPTALVGGEVVWWAAGWNEFVFDGKPFVVPYANGWLLACSKDTWEESGGFDPLYYPYDYEDLDLSTRWHEMGYNIQALNSPVLRHISGATISRLDSNRMANTQLHRQKYIEKWLDRLPQITLLENKDGRNV